MDRNEKKRKREYIGEHINTDNTRFKDDEVEFLTDFIDNYNDYRGNSESKESSYTGWSSDGKYTRKEKFTDTFTEEIGIQHDYEYHDDDGQTGSSSTLINDARGILNWFKNKK